MGSLMKKKLKFSLSTLAIAISINSYADVLIGTDQNNVSVNVNTDDGRIGTFSVYNGTNTMIETFSSGKESTFIRTYSGNQLTLNNDGISLANSNNGVLTLSGVAAGTRATDAVNYSQLSNTVTQTNAITLASANTYTDTGLNTERNARVLADATLNTRMDAVDTARIDGDVATLASANTYTDTGLNTERNARVLADATLNTRMDAADTARIDGDVATLASANTYTDRRFNNIQTKYQAAVASSIAIASLPQPTQPGGSMASFALGQWESEQGYAVGVSGITENNKWVYKAAGTGNSRGNFGGGISVGFQWK
ncbi:YadA-like family protein [Acinetobacter radioresistens]|uniref:YadA-like family protein n=1 Tax=Acinetobacter radioresistens TaxID=40216 RepID=UPI00128BB6C5|nr:YadA-like family protein [Acinetobacter radioresistens]